MPNIFNDNENNLNQEFIPGLDDADDITDEDMYNPQINSEELNNEEELNEEEEEIITEDLESEEENNSDELDNVETEPEVDSNLDDSIKLNVNGTEVNFKDKDELLKVTQNALSSKDKLNKHKDSIALMEGLKDNGVEEEDLLLLAAMKKGDKRALAKLLAKTNIDPLDIDVEPEEIDEYTPEDIKVDMDYLEAKDILADIQQDTEVNTKFDNLVMKEFDNASREIIFKDTNNLKFIAEITKTGLLEQLLPEYTKNKLLGIGENNFDMLIRAYDSYINSQTKQITEKKNAVIAESNTKTAKRKKATVGSKTKNVPTKKEKAIEDMTDEEFNKYYENFMRPGFKV